MKYLINNKYGIVDRKIDQMKIVNNFSLILKLNNFLQFNKKYLN